MSLTKPSVVMLGALNTRTTVNNTAYQILATDVLVVMTAISAARILTLPAASSYPIGQFLTILDESGSSSSTNTISIAPTSTNKIDNSNTTQVCINVPRGCCTLYTNGTDWFLTAISVLYRTALSVDVALPGSYGDIISIAQGTVGKWKASATYVAQNGVGASNLTTRIYDGTTAYQVNNVRLEGNGYVVGGSLSPRTITSPAGNLALQAVNPSLGNMLASYNTFMEVERVI